LRRAVLALGGTVAGMAALLAVKFQPSPSAPLVAGTVAPPSAGAKSQAGTEPSAAAKPTDTGQAVATKVITGSVEGTRYGPMQVQITVTGKRITKVNVLQQTNIGDYSGQVDSFAVPQLTSETLSAQSANIDAVSGASYTSQGYIQSLQSALDQVR
jgi:uncharacterized protein with FMN-binding domain